MGSVCAFHVLKSDAKDPKGGVLGSDGWEPGPGSLIAVWEHSYYRSGSGCWGLQTIAARQESAKGGVWRGLACYAFGF